MTETENLCWLCKKSFDEGDHAQERQMIGSHPFQSYANLGTAHMRQFEEDVRQRAYQLKVERAAAKIIHD